MPIYEYVCTNCGYDFERLQAFSADPVSVCPRCTGKVRRRISPVGVIFKGTGWYITDSRRQLSSGAARPGRQIGSAAGDAAAAAESEPSSAAPKDGRSAAGSGAASADAPASTSDGAGAAEKPARASKSTRTGGSGSGTAPA